MPNEKADKNKTVRISAVKGGYVYFDKGIPRKRRDGTSYLQNGIQAESIKITDSALALQQNALLGVNGIEFELAEFSVPPPGADKNDKAPDINRNPYNFVSLPNGGPWLEEPDPKTGKHHGHQCWNPHLLHGHIDLAITAKSPVFVPARIPNGTKPDSLDFYSLHRWQEDRRVRHYAIPGSSLKGSLRSMVEALSNDRFGVIDDPQYYKMPIPYRRRAFTQHGSLNVGRARLTSGKWLVTAILYDRTGVKVDYPSNLLVQPANHSKCAEVNQSEIYEIPEEVLNKYNENLDHQHYELHFENWKKQWKASSDRSKCKPNYDPSLDAKNFQDVLSSLRMPTAMAEDNPGVLVFFTLKPRTDGVKEIDSFGRNVNYLWPSLWSISDLAGAWFPPSPADKRLGLSKPLGLAERMFGFVSDHDGNGSTAFRGKLKFGPLWAPAGITPVPIELAPLTSPQSRAKSRPLYLAGREDGTSASYSDPAKPELRGRKFYWKQRYEDGGIWDFHRKAATHAADQCPPKLNALPVGTTFTARIHFENLSQPELGVLLYALLGSDPTIEADGNLKSGHHCIHLGKGKPRGLGVCSIEARLTWFKPQEEYASLKTRPERSVAIEDELRLTRRAFANWCEQRARGVGDTRGFELLPHIADFLRLHAHPIDDSVRYYPVNWSQYTWLPEPNKNPDEPKGKRRPPAMKPARELEP